MLSFCRLNIQGQKEYYSSLTLQNRILIPFVLIPFIDFKFPKSTGQFFFRFPFSYPHKKIFSLNFPIKHQSKIILFFGANVKITYKI